VLPGCCTAQQGASRAYIHGASDAALKCLDGWCGRGLGRDATGGVRGSDDAGVADVSCARLSHRRDGLGQCAGGPVAVAVVGWRPHLALVIRNHRAVSAPDRVPRAIGLAIAFVSPSLPPTDTHAVTGAGVNSGPRSRATAMAFQSVHETSYSVTGARDPPSMP
jgi:hypothetical protein